MAREWTQTDTERITFAPYTDTDNLDQITWASWVYVKAGGTQQTTRVFSRRPNPGIMVQVNPDNDHWDFLTTRWDGGFARWITGSGTLPDDTWVHLAATYDHGDTANDPQLYQDGQPINSAESDAPPSSTLLDANTDMIIGNNGDGAVEAPHWGHIADTALWNRLLSDTDINDVYNNGPEANQTNGLVFFCPICGDQDPEPNAYGSDGDVNLVTQSAHPTESDSCSGLIVQVGQASSTDTAQPVSSAKAQAVGQATETETAQPVASAKAQGVGQAVSTEEALPVTAKLGGVTTVPVGQAVDTQSASAVTAHKRVAVGPATESDIAQPVSVSSKKLVTVGQAVSTEEAFGVTGYTAADRASLRVVDLRARLAPGVFKADLAPDAIAAPLTEDVIFPATFGDL